MTTQELTFAERAHNAAKAFLEGRGYEILDDLGQDGIFNFICKDEGVTVLVSTCAFKTSLDALGGFGKDPLHPREEIEKATIELIATKKNFPVNRPIRYDEVHILAIGENKAYIRHHVNAQA